MKAVQKIIASLLALTMAASAGIGALADDDKIETNGGAASVPVTIAAAQATTFSVKVPSSLPLTIKADGSVEVPTNLMIENDSAGPVKVTKIEATKGSWGLAEYGSNFDAMSVNAKKLGFKLNDATTIDSADATQTLANFDASKWTIGGNKKLPITVDADASAVSEAVANASAASVVFTIAWDEADGTETTTPPEQTSEPTPTADPSPTPTPTPTPTPAPKYTVTFVTGEGSEVDSQQVEEGKTAARPDEPTLDGYIFDGWYEDEELTKAFDFTQAITAATNIYAKWTVETIAPAVVKLTMTLNEQYIDDEEDEVTEDDEQDYEVQDYGREMVIGFGASVAGGVTIDWGDGETETSKGTEYTEYTHRYNTDTYTIKLNTVEGCELNFYDEAKSSYRPITPSWEAGYCLEAVELGDTMTKVPAGMFSGWCTSLKSVTIPSSVRSIGDYAFNGTSLTSVTIPSSVRSIGDYAFYNCSSLKSVTIPSSVRSIGDYAFNGTSLTSVTIPSSVKSIGTNAFSRVESVIVVIPAGCTDINLESLGYELYGKVTAFVADADNTAYSTEDGVLFDKDKTTLINYPKEKTVSSYTIPDGVKSIGDSVFRGRTSLTSVTIPNSVKSIGDYAFYDCDKLESVTIPNSVTSIGYEAFYDCDKLTSVTIPNSVTSIGERAFSFCDKLNVTIPSSVKSIGYYAFWGVESVIMVIPAGCTDFNLESLGYELYCNVTAFVADADNTAYSTEDGVLFDKDKTTLINYPMKKAISSYTIPDSVTSIGDDTFRSCKSLKSVTIGSNVTSIGRNAFRYCTSLTSVTMKGSEPPTLGSVAFDGTPSDLMFYVPSSAEETYKTKWSAYASRITAITEG